MYIYFAAHCCLYFMALWYETGNGPVRASLARKENNCVAFLCGGGPSLNKIDPNFLNGHNRLVFALNNTYPRVKPDVWIGMDDPSCYRRDVFWQPFIKIMRGGYQRRLCEGQRIDHLHNMYYADVGELADPEEIFKLRAHDVRFVWAQNVFTTALHIIMWMGCKKIYLFGCDFHTSEGDYHDGGIILSDENKDWNERLYEQLYEYMNWFVSEAPNYGVEVYSCSPDSKINNFINYVNYKDVVTELEINLPETKELLHSKDAAVREVARQKQMKAGALKDV